MINALCLIICTLFLSSCNSNAIDETPYEPAEWSIYLYLCGSNLESQFGSASADLEEMLKVSLPEDVKVIIETGGSKKWVNRKIKANETGRYLYDHNGLKKLQALEQSNMGAADTLSDFLVYCYEIHPAENSILILWDHGGGVLGGIAYDENYALDSITLRELQSAFQKAFPDQSKALFDIIGFDACLMANIDTAQMIQPYASYMIASQELEPGNGWNYTGILKAIADNPQITPKELGIEVCDTFIDGCIEYDTDAEATLSLIDLTKSQVLFDCFTMFGNELLLRSLNDDTVFALLGRAAEEAEEYGSNTKEQGYTNMVDLGGILRAEKDFAYADQILSALEDCVVYQVKGPYRSYGSGLSCYYPFDHALSNLFEYKENSFFYGYQNLYQYQLSGKLGSALLDYLENENIIYDKEQQKITVDQLGLENFPVTVSKSGEMILDIGNRAHYLKQVSGYLSIIDYDSMTMIGIGNEAVENADWDNGVFKYPYRTEWFHLNGHLIYTFCIEDSENYNIYAAPILLNGDRVFLRIAENNLGEVEILGARNELGYNDMPDKQLIHLEAGDEIATLFYQADLGEDNYDLELKEYERFVIEEEAAAAKFTLNNGIYVWAYDMNDMWNNFATSELTMYELIDGVATAF